MALGALPANVLCLVMGEALATTALGIGLGLAACLGLMRCLASLLFEIPPSDALTIAAVSLVGVVALQHRIYPLGMRRKWIPVRRCVASRDMGLIHCAL